MKLIAFCEAPADFSIASSLLDRVLCEDGPTWIADLFDVAPETIRSWEGDGDGHAFWNLHRVGSYARRLLSRVPHGHFDGQPGAAGALMARTAFYIVRALLKRPNVGPVDGVIIVWDMDDQAKDRRTGLTQARTEAERWKTFRIVLGCPDMMREAWVLAGFDPLDQDERDRLDELRRDLGFSPNEEAHLLTAKDEQA